MKPSETPLFSLLSEKLLLHIYKSLQVYLHDPDDSIPESELDQIRSFLRAYEHYFNVKKCYDV